MAESEDPATGGLIDLAAASYGRARESELSSHPSPEALVEFQEGRLHGPQADALRSHVVACEACAEQLQRLDDFDREPAISPAADVTARRSWEWFRATVGLEPERHRADLDIASRRAEAPGRRHVWALAASVAFAAIGVGFFLAAALRPPRPGGVDSPATQPFVFDLLPDGTQERRDASGIEVVNVPAGMDPLVVRLLLGDQTPHATYSAVVSGRTSGEVVLRQRQLRRQAAGEFPLQIPRASLPSGDWVIHLDGEQDGRTERLASYTLRVEYGE